MRKENNALQGREKLLKDNWRCRKCCFSAEYLAKNSSMLPLIGQMWTHKSCHGNTS